MVNSILVGGSVLVSAHDGEHARRLFGVCGVFRPALQFEGVVVDLEKVGLARELEVSEIMLAMRIIVRIECGEALYAEDDLGFYVQRQFCDALRHDNLTTNERGPKIVI